MWNNLFRTKNIEKIIADADAESLHGGGLKRVLTLKDLTFFGIAAIIGAGSFSSLGQAIFQGGPGVIILFIICGVACAFTAMCYAEFASRIPVAGSAYTYAYASFGELFAWIIGWALIMEYSIGNIYVAYSWSDYFTSFLSKIGVHLPDYLTASYTEVKKAIADGTSNKEFLSAWKNAPNFLNVKFIIDLPAFVINILITYLVYIGVKESKNFSNAMVILKLCVVFLVIVLGIQYVETANWLPKNEDGVRSFMPNGFSGVMKAVSGVFFAYIGFDAISVMAEESKNPQRDLPRSMILSLIICTVIYILLTLVLTGALNYADYENVGDPLAKIFEANGNGWMQFLVSICAIVAITSVLLVFQLGQPRIWMSMSRDGLMPKKFAQIHPKYNTPQFATIITGLVVGIPLLFTDRNFILDFTSIGTLFAFVLVCGGVLLLPRKTKVAGKFSIPFINAKYIFPLLIGGSMLLIGLTNKEYFKELFQMELNSTERSTETFKFIKEKSNVFKDDLLTNSIANDVLRTKKLKTSPDGIALLNQLAINNKIGDSLNFQVARTAFNLPSTKNVLNGNVDTNSIFTTINREGLINSIWDYIQINKKNFTYANEGQLNAIAKTKFWDTSYAKKSINQLVYNNILKDSLGKEKLQNFLFNEDVNKNLNSVTYSNLNEHLDDKSFAKKTSNISLIFFWLCCIALALFAFIKNWSLIPMLGLVSCMYLLTGMGASNWKWFAIWFAIGLVVYALYGYKKSKLA